MTALLEPALTQLGRARIVLDPVRLGRVVRCDGGLIEVAGLPVPVGTLCRIAADHDAPECTAEVIGFRAGHSLMMLLGDSAMLHPGARVRAEGRPGLVQVGAALLGRAVDGNGRPLDGGPRPHCEAWWPLGGKREGALERGSVTQPFDCGVRAINALTTVGVGQRVGIMAGSGVGKSVLIDMIAEAGEADVTVIALVGERAREVSDFARRHLTGPNAARTALVAVPADHAPNVRLRGAQFACALAEHFREQGLKVLLILDSLTRLAHAAREIGFLLGEPGAARGYPPSALAAITRLVERAGNSASSGGSITGFYTVLADGDDQADPVVDTARAILDGHLVLSRELAQQGHYPAIDIPASLSRVMDAIVDPAHRGDARAFRALMASWQANRDLVMMGAYRPGADPQLDRAMALKPRLDALLMQESHERAGLAASVAALHTAMADG